MTDICEDNEWTPLAEWPPMVGMLTADAARRQAVREFLVTNGGTLLQDGSGHGQG